MGVCHYKCGLVYNSTVGFHLSRESLKSICAALQFEAMNQAVDNSDVDPDGSLQYAKLFDYEGLRVTNVLLEELPFHCRPELSFHRFQLPLPWSRGRRPRRLRPTPAGRARPATGEGQRATRTISMSNTLGLQFERRVRGLVESRTFCSVSPEGTVRNRRRGLARCGPDTWLTRGRRRGTTIRGQPPGAGPG